MLSGVGNPEGFSWKRFLSGIINPLNFAKSFVFMIQIALILLILSCVLWASLAVKRKFLKPKSQPSPVCISTTSGNARSSQDEVSNKFGLLNF